MTTAVIEMGGVALALSRIVVIRKVYPKYAIEIQYDAIDSMKTIEMKFESANERDNAYKRIIGHMDTI